MGNQLWNWYFAATIRKDPDYMAQLLSCYQTGARGSKSDGFETKKTSMPYVSQLVYDVNIELSEKDAIINGENFTSTFQSERLEDKVFSMLTFEYRIRDGWLDKIWNIDFMY